MILPTMILLDFLMCRMICRLKSTRRCQVWITLAVCVSFCGCGSSAGDGGDRPLVVVVSGDTAGWIVPCGCASNQSGGLPRRGSYVKQLGRTAEVLVVDVGGAPSGTSDYERVKFESILKGEIAMGVVAHNIGASEIALGTDYLRSAAKDLGVPLISANVRDSHGRLVAEPIRVVKAGGRRIAFVGVVSQRFATEGTIIDPPGRCVLDTIKEAPRYDHVVVLAYLSEGELRELASSLPEVDVVVGGPTGQSVLPEPVGATLLASATNMGKFIARLNVPARGTDERFTGSVVEMNERFEDDPRQIANLDEFYDELARRDFSPERTSFGDSVPANLPEGYRVAGTESCRACHQDDCRQWDDSAHARAWKALSATGAHVDPYCQQCHTTGYGLPGGFASAKRSKSSVAVGCESCHGPSQAHVRQPNTRTAFFGQAKGQCVTCHDRDNSPSFVYDEYWPKIHHGDSPPTSAQPTGRTEKTSDGAQ